MVKFRCSAGFRSYVSKYRIGSRHRRIQNPDPTISGSETVLIGTHHPSSAANLQSLDDDTDLQTMMNLKQVVTRKYRRAGKEKSLLSDLFKAFDLIKNSPNQIYIHINHYGLPMVLISDCNSETSAHKRTRLSYSICLRHLI